MKVSKDGLCRSNDEKGDIFLAIYENISMNQQLQEQVWVEDLKDKGYSAAHPNDGWVNRHKNEVVLCYPYFETNVTIGAKIMLGSPSNKTSHRSVIVTGIRKSTLSDDLIYYSFKDDHE